MRYLRRLRLFGFISNLLNLSKQGKRPDFTDYYKDLTQSVSLLGPKLDRWYFTSQQLIVIWFLDEARKDILPIFLTLPTFLIKYAD